MNYEIVIIGAGITGLKVANSANELGLKNVLLLDYKKEKGGFASSLLVRDEFKKENDIVLKSKELPYDIWYQSTVVGFFEGTNNHQLSVQTSTGYKEIKANKIIICTGALEKPREAHKISGSRPAGVMTPLMALELMDRGLVPGENIVIKNNSRIANEVAKILIEKGLQVKEIKSSNDVVSNIEGNSRVNRVELCNSKTLEKQLYDCDTLIFSEGLIPCTFFLKGSGVDLDEHQFINVNDYGETNISRVSALGSCTTEYKEFDLFSRTTKEKIIKILKE